MSEPTDKKPSWVEIGRSTTTPTTNTQRKEVKVDDYYVVVGFEVNNPDAFVNDVQDLGAPSRRDGSSFGHAFYYVVKNKVVSMLLSFGPASGVDPASKEAPKIGWLDKGSRSDTAPNKYDTGALIKDGRKNARLGTPDYGISELVTAFKIPLTLKQGLALEKETQAMREQISSGKQKYTVYMNDTCAETARDVLSSAGIDTPSGAGAVKHSGVANFALVYAVNPYMWHKNFAKSAYQKGSRPAEGEWTPKLGGKEPIVAFK
jgi:hypothetical protein